MITAHINIAKRIGSNWKTFFECIRQHLSGEPVIEIDDNGSMETELLAEGCIRGASRTVVCRISGHIIRRRGPFPV
jgi:hypothetical protein